MLKNGIATIHLQNYFRITVMIKWVLFEKHTNSFQFLVLRLVSIIL